MSQNFHVQRLEEKLRQNKIPSPKDLKKKIAAWVGVIEESHLGQDEVKIQRLKEYYFRHHVIQPDQIPGSYFDGVVYEARQRGIALEMTPEVRLQKTHELIEDQRASLNNWLNYFLEEDTSQYPMWAKIWIFEEMKKLKELQTAGTRFQKRSQGSVAMFPELNREALGLVLDALLKKVEKTDTAVSPSLLQLFQKQKVSFARLYKRAIDLTTTERRALKVTEGKWVLFKQGSDPKKLVEALDCKGTGWCTRGEETARKYLNEGDHWVYMSLDVDHNPTQPRIGIATRNNKVIEVRGIAVGQHLDPEMTKTTKLEDKLKDFGESGLKYQKKSQQMRELTRIEGKIDKNQPLSKEELRFIYEVDEKVESFGLLQDPRIRQITSTRDTKEDLSIALGIPKEKISLTQTEALSGGIEYHHGDLNLDHIQNFDEISLPKAVGGDLGFSRIESAKGIVFPESVGGTLWLNHLNSVEGLILPKSIRGDLKLGGLKSAKGLKFPEFMGGGISLNGLETAKGLRLPDSIQGDLWLQGLKSPKGLELPEFIGGDLRLNGLETSRGLILPKYIGKDLNLSNIDSANGLVFPESIYGSLYLNKIETTKGLELPKSIRESIRLDRLKSAKDLRLPDSVGDGIYLDGLESTKGLKLSKVF